MPRCSDGTRVRHSGNSPVCPAATVASRRPGGAAPHSAEQRGGLGLLEPQMEPAGPDRAVQLDEHRAQPREPQGLPEQVPMRDHRQQPVRRRLALPRVGAGRRAEFVDRRRREHPGHLRRGPRGPRGLCALRRARRRPRGSTPPAPLGRLRTRRLRVVTHVSQLRDHLDPARFALTFVPLRDQAPLKITGMVRRRKRSAPIMEGMTK